MRFVSTDAMVAELQRKLKDGEQQIRSCAEAERLKLEQEAAKYRELLALARSDIGIW
jgi:hypothetical protein